MRKILEDLIFLGRIEDEVTILGKKWKLATLTSEEYVETTNNTAHYDTISRIYSLKIEILSRALKGIDDIVLDDAAETLELENKLQPALVNKLYEKYEEMQIKQNSSLEDLTEIKN